MKISVSFWKRRDCFIFDLVFGKIAPVTARNHLLSDRAAQQVLVTLHFLVLVNLLKAIAIADTFVALIQQVNCQSSCLWSDIGSSLKSQ